MSKTLIAVEGKLFVIDDSGVAFNGRGGPVGHMIRPATAEDSKLMFEQDQVVSNLFEGMVNQATQDAIQSVTDNLKSITLQMMGFDDRWSSRMNFRDINGDHPIAQIVKLKVEPVVTSIIDRAMASVTQKVWTKVEAGLTEIVESSIEHTLNQKLREMVHRQTEAIIQELGEELFASKKEELMARCRAKVGEAILSQSAPDRRGRINPVGVAMSNANVVVGKVLDEA